MYVVLRGTHRGGCPLLLVYAPLVYVPGNNGGKKCTEQKPQVQHCIGSGRGRGRRGVVRLRCVRETTRTNEQANERLQPQGPEDCARYPIVLFCSAIIYVQGGETRHCLFATGYIITYMYRQPSSLFLVVPLHLVMYPREITTLECTRTRSPLSFLFLFLFLRPFLSLGLEL